MEKAELVKRKSDLMAAIWRIGSLYSASAESAAMTAVRKVGNKDAMDYARLELAKHETREFMAKEIIDQVHRFWPTEE